MQQDINKGAVITKVACIYIVFSLFNFINLSSAYNFWIENISTLPYMYPLTYNDFENCICFVIIGVIGCVLICRQHWKAFLGKARWKETGVLISAHILYGVGIILVGEKLGGYQVNWYDVLVALVSQLIFVAFLEEWICRGFIINQLSILIEKRSVIIALSSVLFSLMHLPAYLKYEEISLGGIIYRLLIPLLLGIVLAIIYIYKNNLIICVLIHGFYNFISEVTFNSWQYVSYGIYWIFLLVLVIWCVCKEQRLNTN